MPLSISAGKIWKPLLVAAAVAFAYWGVLARLGRFWWDDENYSHGLLMPFVIGYILWAEREKLADAVGRPRAVWGAAAVVAALLALWVGTAGAELFTQRMSLVLLLAGVCVYFWGWRLLRALLVPLALLALAVPIPAIVFNKIAFPLQLFASQCAVFVMRALNITVLREGNVIELYPLGSLTTKRLEVVEACSGIRSLMTLVTLAVVFAYFTSPTDEGGTGGKRFERYRVWRAVLIVVAAVPIAIITNAARVSGTGVLARYYGTEVADGFFHEFSGWVIYIAAFLLLFAFGWLVDRFNPSRGGGKGRGGGEAVVTESAEAHAPSVVNEAPVVAAPATAAMSVKES
ncbi:MAG TPA: exosortase/archaeosortase family protein [Pyrinomonadaceae bacterium]|jgi:exosortase|nr:exosortase/archaeosortase family protein [Pyrinomonadaceae bacterium]